MGRKQRGVPFPVDGYVEPENTRKSSMLDPSPLVSQQFHRPPTDGQPMGPSEDIHVSRSSSWSNRHGDFGED